MSIPKSNSQLQECCYPLTLGPWPAYFPICLCMHFYNIHVVGKQHACEKASLVITVNHKATSLDLRELAGETSPLMGRCFPWVPICWVFFLALPVSGHNMCQKPPPFSILLHFPERPGLTPSLSENEHYVWASSWVCNITNTDLTSLGAIL